MYRFTINIHKYLSVRPEEYATASLRLERAMQLLSGRPDDQTLLCISGNRSLYCVFSAVKAVSIMTRFHSLYPHQSGNKTRAMHVHTVHQFRVHSNITCRCIGHFAASAAGCRRSIDYYPQMTNVG